MKATNIKSFIYIDVFSFENFYYTTEAYDLFKTLLS